MISSLSYQKFTTCFRMILRLNLVKILYHSYTILIMYKMALFWSVCFCRDFKSDTSLDLYLYISNEFQNELRIRSIYSIEMRPKVRSQLIVLRKIFSQWRCTGQSPETFLSTEIFLFKSRNDKEIIQLFVCDKRFL